MLRFTDKQHIFLTGNIIQYFGIRDTKKKTHKCAGQKLKTDVLFRLFHAYICLYIYNPFGRNCYYINLTV